MMIVASANTAAAAGCPSKEGELYGANEHVPVRELTCGTLEHHSLCILSSACLRYRHQK